MNAFDLDPSEIESVLRPEHVCVHDAILVREIVEAFGVNFFGHQRHDLARQLMSHDESASLELMGLLLGHLDLVLQIVLQVDLVEEQSDVVVDLHLFNARRRLPAAESRAHAKLLNVRRVLLFVVAANGESEHSLADFVDGGAGFLASLFEQIKRDVLVKPNDTLFGACVLQPHGIEILGKLSHLQKHIDPENWSKEAVNQLEEPVDSINLRQCRKVFAFADATEETPNADAVAESVVLNHDDSALSWAVIWNHDVEVWCVVEVVEVVHHLLLKHGLQLLQSVHAVQSYKRDLFGLIPFCVGHPFEVESAAALNEFAAHPCWAVAMGLDQELFHGVVFKLLNDENTSNQWRIFRIKMTWLEDSVACVQSLQSVESLQQHVNEQVKGPGEIDGSPEGPKHASLVEEGHQQLQNSPRYGKNTNTSKLKQKRLHQIF